MTVPSSPTTSKVGSRRQVGVLTLAALMLGASTIAPTADAAGRPTVVWIEDGILHVEAASSVVNQVVVLTAGDRLSVRDRTGGVAAAQPCLTTSDPALVTCPVAGLLRAEVSLGEGNDEFTNLSTFATVVTTGSGDDRVVDGGPSSQVDLGAGNDRIEPGAGPQSVRGGPGIDVVDYSIQTSAVRVNLDDKANDGESGEDNIGSDFEQTIGGRGNDTLIGNTGNNLLRGGPGADRLRGGAGSDTVSYDEFGRAGIGTTVTLDGVKNDGAAGENDDVGADIENIEGSPEADLLIGNDGANLIVGLNGDDLIRAGGGDDLIAAGPASVIQDGVTGADDVAGGTGFDSVSYSTRTARLSVTLDGKPNDGEPDEGDNIRTDVEHVIGGSGNDILSGSDSTNILRGLGGNDTLTGSGGNDSLEGGGGRDVLFGGTGIDTATYMSHAGGVAVTLDGKANDGSPNEADNVQSDIENIIGSNHNDTLVGSPTANVLRGAAGDDRLFGRAGSDTLIGDSGADQGFGDAGRDTCTTERRSSCP